MMNGSSPRLAIGERVVLLRDGDAEYGFVRWIGSIPGYPTSMVGVEFENPIGSGSGYYHGKRLFTAKMNYAALVPVEGLLRAIDYDKGESANVGNVRRDLLIDLDDTNDTTVWPSKPTSVIIDDGDGDTERRLERTAIDNTRTQGICIGTIVEVSIFVNIITPDIIRHGVVRWIGDLPGIEALMAGVELETDLPYWSRCATDGTYKNRRYFYCQNRRGIFAPLSTLHQDRRGTQDLHERSSCSIDDTMPELPCPWKTSRIQFLVGKPRGIQGKSNSCYLDATLFALFATSDAFGDILSRPKRRTDIELYDDIRTCLKFSIVAPLRWRGYVDDDSIMKLRRLLSHALPSMSGLTTEEKDPEELISALFGSVLRVEPDIHLTSGQSSYICPLVIDDAFPKTSLTSVQTLLERSFFCSNVQLHSVPNRFIVQLPRYGKQKLYDYIVPTLRVDLSNILANRRRNCFMCGRLAQLQCKECYLTETSDYSMTFFCNICFGRFHATLRRHNDHQVTSIPGGLVSPTVDSEESPYLELSSVICIESSHYVSFVRIRDGDSGAKWLFADSMADREGGDVTGHNIPEVAACDDYFEDLLKNEHRHLLTDALPLPINRKSVQMRRFGSDPLPRFIDRILQDCYICVYERSQGR